MWLWFLLHTKAYFLDDVTARYRILQNSASHSTDIRKVIAFEESVLDIKIFFIRKYWNNNKVLLKNAYTVSTWLLFRLLIVNSKDKQAFNLFFERFWRLKTKRKIYGLILWIFPKVCDSIRLKWMKFTRLFC